MTDYYFDNAATTRVRPEVIEEMMPFFDTYYANSSGTGAAHKRSKTFLDNYRERLAAIIGAKPQEIIFTSGATEANNAIISGFLLPEKNHTHHILTSKIEHESIIRPCQQFEKEGWDFNLINVDYWGFVDQEDLQLLLKPQTVFLSIMHGNNEIGTIQPLKELSEIIKDKDILFHTDAAQTLGKIPFNVGELGIDAASFSAHKIYGPKGVGALYIKDNFMLRPLIQGGLQEFSLRAGTTNLPLIAGFVKAVELAIEEMELTTKHLHHLTTYIIDKIGQIEGVKLNGTPDILLRIPGNISITIEASSQEVLLETLSEKGIMVSSCSACCSGKKGLSRVLKAIGLQENVPLATIRISLGKDTTLQQCQYLVEMLESSIKKAKLSVQIF